MGLSFDTRTSDSSWISTVWTCASEDVAMMRAVASETWGLVFWSEDGSPQAAVVGPQSRTSVASVPSEAIFVGIEFTVGTSLRIADTISIVDAGIALPDARSRSFWLDGRRWTTPGADDAELFVDQLIRHGVIARDPVVTAVVRGDRPVLSSRTVERRFRVATGLTRGTIAQIERVRTASAMLATGERVADIVDRLGYFDEPHLALMLRRYIGRSAQQLRSGAGGAIGLDIAQRTRS